MPVVVDAGEQPEPALPLADEPRDSSALGCKLEQEQEWVLEDSGTEVGNVVKEGVEERFLPLWADKPVVVEPVGLAKKQKVGEGNETMLEVILHLRCSDGHNPGSNWTNG